MKNFTVVTDYGIASNGNIITYVTMSPIFTFFSITEKGPTSTLTPRSAHSAIIAVG